MKLKEQVFNFLGRNVFKADYQRLKAEEAQVARLEKLVAEAKNKGKAR